MHPRILVAGALLLALLSSLWPGAGPVRADQEPGLSTGQLLYVASYNHIYHGTQKKPFYLTITLSVRNVDPARSLEVTRIDYYDTEGRLLTSYLEEPRLLRPLETMEIAIQEKENDAGSGDNFLVGWRSDQPINAPLVEAVMIGTASAQGISFTSRGVVVQE